MRAVGGVPLHRASLPVPVQGISLIFASASHSAPMPAAFPSQSQKFTKN
jgi:hypothetical protein